MDGNTYPTAGGHEVRVSGPDAGGGFSTPCTGCGTNDHSQDIPEEQREAAMHRWAAYHAKHCNA